ncbi:MAG: 5-formyltetrahydrofolate cyclo-ligase [Armatimonadetes bacterium]|nr:5-formyltetrahydrofolate cyclo-ligase [Armatimonadota bacterium]
MKAIEGNERVMTSRIPLSRFLNRRERLRRRIWHLMEAAGVLTFPLDVFGKVPNFIGAERAAELLAQQIEFEQAKVIFVSPDHVLRRVRELVLERGKILAISLPQPLIRQGKPKLLQITERKTIKAATNVDNFLRYGQPLSQPVDLAVLSSVVVDRKGNRLTPRKEFGDKYWHMLLESGFAHKGTKIATIVHPLQFADDLAKWITEEDVKADLIVTPEEVIRGGGERNGVCPKGD